jgi:hypothetical protein
VRGRQAAQAQAQLLQCRSSPALQQLPLTNAALGQPRACARLSALLLPCNRQASSDVLIKITMQNAG